MKYGKVSFNGIVDAVDRGVCNNEVQRRIENSMPQYEVTTMVVPKKLIDLLAKAKHEDVKILSFQIVRDSLSINVGTFKFDVDSFMMIKGWFRDDIIKCFIYRGREY